MPTSYIINTLNTSCLFLISLDPTQSRHLYSYKKLYNVSNNSLILYIILGMINY